MENDGVFRYRCFRHSVVI
ncbi:ubiquinone oxidoreductase, Na(+)-translocating, B subunit, partial [Chlamydia psittaci 06-1683]